MKPLVSNCRITDRGTARVILSVGLCCYLLSGCVVHRTADKTRTLSPPGLELPLKVPANTPIRVHKPDRVARVDKFDESRKLVWPKWALPHFFSNFFSKVSSPIELNRPDYQVQPGDTLSEIAQSHRVSTQRLAKINGLESPHSIYAGQSLSMVDRHEDAALHKSARQPTRLNGSKASENIKSNKKVVFDKK